MKYFSLLLTVVFLVSCVNRDPKPIEPPKHEVVADDTITLSNITNAYINLQGLRSVWLKGDYSGDRIVLRNAQNCKIYVTGAILSDHKEDAIVFSTPVKNVQLIGLGVAETNGAITSWATIDSLDVTGFFFYGGHLGFRATKDQVYNRVHIRDNYFANIEKEGIYIGPSKESEVKSSNIHVYDNLFSGIKWDAIQLGNCLNCSIHDNEVHNAGTENTYGQNWGITVNPGSVVYIYGNTYDGFDMHVQCLDSRCFLSATKVN